jgi:hemerythrin
VSEKNPPVYLKPRSVSDILQYMNNVDHELNAPGIVWQKELSVGVAEFDNHHKRIIDLINKLQASVVHDREGRITREVLVEVLNYTIYHFSAEEDLMDKYGFPGYAAHREEHLALTSKTLQLTNDAFLNKTNIGDEVLAFLISWLKNHIMITDKQYAVFFMEKGLS